MSRYPTLKLSIETVTPTMAKEWLEGNVHNRKVSDRLVDVYAETILTGEWRLNGEPIIFDRTGVLQSGQHRLLAVLEAGKSIKTVVVRGADPEGLYSIDSGRRRRMTDVLTLKGEKDTSNLAAALSWLWRIQSGQAVHLGNSPSNTQLLKLLDQTPEIRDSLAWARATRKMLHFSIGLMTALHYLMNEIDPEDCASFFEGIATGVDLQAGDARHTLINWARRTEKGKARRPSQTMVAAVVIKAWNAYREVRDIRMLAFKPNEKFPELI